MIKKIIRNLKRPKIVILYLISNSVLSRLIPDAIFLKIKYRLRIGKKLNLSNPKTFNEKLQWLKINDSKPEYTSLVDKYKVREYIATNIGEKYLIPLLGVYSSYDEIDFNKLPNEFVLKPNHTSGNIFICKDKIKVSHIELKKTIKKWLNRKYYWIHREWPYKNIKPKILCEKYMVDESGLELKDYKFLCFNGLPKIIQVMSGRNNRNYNINHFDLKWKRLKISRKNHQESQIYFNKPMKLNEMVSICKILSKKIPFVRIDFYSINELIFIGEITFYPTSGFMDFTDEKDDYLLGSWIKLSKK